MTEKHVIEVEISGTTINVVAATLEGAIHLAKRHWRDSLDETESQTEERVLYATIKCEVDCIEGKLASVKGG